MSEEMTHDEFEEWIETHKDEAVANLPTRGSAKKPLGSWLASFYNELRNMAMEESPADSGDDDIGDDEGDDS